MSDNTFLPEGWTFEFPHAAKRVSKSVRSGILYHHMASDGDHFREYGYDLAQAGIITIEQGVTAGIDQILLKEPTTPDNQQKLRSLFALFVT